MKRALDPNGGRSLAMFGIVVGHVAYSFTKLNIANFKDADRELVYDVINQPCLFMFIILAGMVHAFSRGQVSGPRQYWQFIRGKFLRLMVPYLSVSLATLVVKLVAPGGIMKPAEIPVFLGGMVVAPRHGPSAHLWFLYMLMTIFLLWPLLGRLTCGKRFPFLIAALMPVAVLPIPWPRYVPSAYYLGLGSLQMYAPFFLLGYWLAARSAGVLRWSGRSLVISGGVFLGLLILKRSGLLPTEGYAWVALGRAVRLGCYTAGALMYYWLAGLTAWHLRRLRRVLADVAFHSYEIYLLHFAFVTHPLVFAISKLVPGPALTFALLVPLTLIVILVTQWAAKLLRLQPLLGFFFVGAPFKSRSRPAGAKVVPAASETGRR